MKTAITCFSLLASLMLVCNSTAAGERRLEIYSTGTSETELMAKLAEAILDGEGRVIPDPAGRRLLILTTPALHTTLRQALETTMANNRNVQLQINFDEDGKASETGGALEGAVIIGPQEKNIQLRPSVHHRTTDSTSSVQQMLVAASGTEATLRVGTSMPYLEWTVDYARYHPMVHVGTRWEDVGAFLVFQPVIQPDGETIHIRLTPEIRGIASDGKNQTYRFTTVETAVVVRNGETRQIGGWQEASNIFETFLFGATRRESSKDLRITIVPRILP